MRGPVHTATAPGTSGPFIGCSHSAQADTEVTCHVSRVTWHVGVSTHQPQNNVSYICIKLRTPQEFVTEANKQKVQCSMYRADMADNFSLVSSCFQIHIYLLSPGSCSRWVTFKVSDKDKLMTKFPEKSAKITTSGGGMGKYLVFILDSDTHCKVFAEHVVSPQQIEMSVYLKHVHTVRQCCLCLQWPNIHSKSVINGRDNLRKQQ